MPLDPWIGARQALFQRDLRLPIERLSQLSIVGVAPPHPLRTRDVLLGDLGPGHFCNDVGELIDRHHAILPQVEGRVVPRAHQAEQPFQAIVDVTERAGLLAVPPDLHLSAARELRPRHLAAQRGGYLLATALPGAERPEDVVKANDPGLDVVLLPIVLAQSLADQLFPTVGILGRCRIGVFFLKRRHRGRSLEVFRIDARRGGVEIAADAVEAGRFERMGIDQEVVVQDAAVVAGDEAHAAHVGCQRIDLVDPACGLETVGPSAQVDDLELVGIGLGILGKLDVRAAYPVAVPLEQRHQVVPDESSGPRDENPLCRHGAPLLRRLATI